MPLNTKSDLDSYGCVMLDVDIELTQYQNIISQDDLFSDGEYSGKVDAPHVTLLYGLTQSYKLDEIEKIVSKESFDNIVLKDVIVFGNDERDVLVFEVDKTSNLVNSNKSLRDNLEYYSECPEYKPHVTICYVKAGLGQNYKEKILDTFKDSFPINCKISGLFYSDISGEEFHEPLMFTKINEKN
jgi:2'-5' RNA ligase